MNYQNVMAKILETEKAICDYNKHHKNDRETAIAFTKIQEARMWFETSNPTDGGF